MAVSQVPSMQTRIAGGLLLGSFVVLFAWRLVIVEAILGPVNPADDLPGAKRAVLASGLLVGSVLAAIGFTQLARQLRGTSAGRWAQVGQYTAQAAPVVLAIGILGILANPTFEILFTAYAVLATGSWIIFGVTLWRVGFLRWLGLVTAILGAAMLLGVLAGAFIIFIMSIALLPLGVGLIARRQSTLSARMQMVGSAAD